ncbi:CPBP family intramembrane glutamic endopeptidase [Niveibacterium sp. 24ML]|uniref:CPBP family intramembrane glutamic endopeptidase n=1 Tax=Niveibacterium sp. 24ML TaxID=2985512 RepID=UPI00226FFEEF|nr:CPBP family intramembrane glutamic endopeptidase [Niveibacterium sp. 24ML]
MKRAFSIKLGLFGESWRNVWGADDGVFHDLRTLERFFAFMLAILAMTSWFDLLLVPGSSPSLIEFALSLAPTVLFLSIFLPNGLRQAPPAKTIFASTIGIATFSAAVFGTDAKALFLSDVEAIVGALLRGISVGVAEEWVFRIFLFWTLASRFGIGGYILISSVAFSALHFPPSISGFLFLVLVSVVLSLTFIATRSFFAVALMHAGHNAWTGVYDLLGREGLSLAGDLASGLEVAAWILVGGWSCVTCLRWRSPVGCAE